MNSDVLKIVGAMVAIVFCAAFLIMRMGSGRENWFPKMERRQEDIACPDCGDSDRVIETTP